MYVIKRDGRQELVHFDKITSRIQRLCYGLNNEFVDPVDRTPACGAPLPSSDMAKLKQSVFIISESRCREVSCGLKQTSRVNESCAATDAGRAGEIDVILKVVSVFENSADSKIKGGLPLGAEFLRTNVEHIFSAILVTGKSKLSG